MCRAERHGIAEHSLEEGWQGRWRRAKRDGLRWCRRSPAAAVRDERQRERSRGESGKGGRWVVRSDIARRRRTQVAERRRNEWKEKRQRRAVETGAAAMVVEAMWAVMKGEAAMEEAAMAVEAMEMAVSAAVARAMEVVAMGAYLSRRVWVSEVCWACMP